MCLEVSPAESWPVVCVLRLIFKFFSCFILNVLVIANVVYLSDDARHEHFLGEEIHKETSNHYEELLETTQVSQKCEDVSYLALIGIIELVGTDVDSN